MFRIIMVKAVPGYNMGHFLYFAMRCILAHAVRRRPDPIHLIAIFADQEWEKG